MSLSQILNDPLVLGGGLAGLIIALSKLIEVLRGKHADNETAKNQRDQQEHVQQVEVAKILADQLEKADARITQLRESHQAMGERYTELYASERETRAEVNGLKLRAESCEKDRDMMRGRLRLLEQRVHGKAMSDNPAEYQDPYDTQTIDDAEKKVYGGKKNEPNT